MPLALTKTLISRRSVTPDDDDCQSYLAARLQNFGFKHESFNHREVTNSWLRRGSTSPLLVFAGHTDVVPAGDEAAWHSDPFMAIEKNGYLYGRGVADMKGGIAAMTVACERFIREHPDHTGSIALLLTSDEEGPALNGTRHVIEQLSQRNETIDWCIIAEPSSDQYVGDTIRNGRRGSMTGYLTIKGKQGHVAYPDRIINPIHQVAATLKHLCTTTWDNGNDYFPPTSFQICKLHADAGADNIVPGQLKITFNFRFSPESNADTLRSRVETLLNEHQIDYDLDWHLSGQPFLTKPGKLIEATQAAVYEVNKHEAKLSTGGGTSDGRFIAPTGAEVIELGLCNETIHQINECARIDDFEQLTQIYLRILKKLLGT